MAADISVVLDTVAAASVAIASVGGASLGMIYGIRLWRWLRGDFDDPTARWYHDDSGYINAHYSRNRWWDR